MGPVRETTPLSGLIGLPVLLQDIQSTVAEQRIAIFISFAALDPDHHPFAVDVRCLQMRCLTNSEPSGVDGCQYGPVLEIVRALKKGSDLFPGQDHGKFLSVLDPGNPDPVPLSFHGRLIEEFHGTVCLVDGGLRDLLLLHEIVKVVANLFLPHLRRRATIMTHKMHHAVQIAGNGLRAEVF